MDNKFVAELLYGYSYVLLYILIVLPGSLLLRIKTKVADEVFRKLLHCILLGIILVWLSVYTHWWIAASACVGLIVLLYPVLTLAGRFRWFTGFFTERKSGEFRSSLILVFVMFAVVICICWGIFEDKLLALASIYAWGPGDAAAALIGKRFARHKIPYKAAGGKKSYEGTFAMFAVSFISTVIILLVRGGSNVPECVVISLITALVSAVIELFSKGGNDTITCPLGAMATLIPLLYLFGGM